MFGTFENPSQVWKNMCNRKTSQEMKKKKQENKERDALNKFAYNQDKNSISEIQMPDI